LFGYLFGDAQFLAALFMSVLHRIRKVIINVLDDVINNTKQKLQFFFANLIMNASIAETFYNISSSQSNRLSAEDGQTYRAR